MTPPAETVHWMFATGILFLGLLKLAEVIAGPVVWRRRRWRPYLLPGLLFGLGVWMWPVMTFYTNSAIHMLAHSAWAQALMVLGAAELGARARQAAQPLVAADDAVRARDLRHGVPRARAERLVVRALGVPAPPARLDARRSAGSSRSSRFLRPRSHALQSGFAIVLIALAVMLYCDRDVAPVFGHLSPLAGEPHR